MKKRIRLINKCCAGIIVSNSEIQRCPHCGYNLQTDERITYKFSSWTTPLMVFILSLMLFIMDLVADGKNKPFIDRIEWSVWAVIGLWIFFISVQLVRYQPHYTWLMIPVSGVLFSLFLAGIDLETGPNNGYANLDWAWYAIIPIVTFVVVLPLIARITRKEPTHYDRLEFLVDHLSEEKS